MNSESLNMFRQKGTIGKGGFGEIIKAEGADGRQYAIKKIPKARKQEHNITREVLAGIKLSHKNIIHYNTHCEDKENDYLVFEFIQGT